MNKRCSGHGFIQSNYEEGQPLSDVCDQPDQQWADTNSSLQARAMRDVTMLLQKDSEAQNLFSLVGISARDAKESPNLSSAHKAHLRLLFGSASSARAPRLNVGSP
jgi:vacuolar-type H+-ATPase catalytic subunit A/Vma1